MLENEIASIIWITQIFPQNYTITVEIFPLPLI